MYKHILLATDLSPSSVQITNKAKELVKIFNAKLSVVHVIEFVPNVYGGGEMPLPYEATLMDTFEKNARSQLKKLAQELEINETDCYLEINSLKHTVVEIAKKVNADLIIVGSHGKHGVQLLLGSGATAILHSAKCDVLAVRIKE